MASLAGSLVVVSVCKEGRARLLVQGLVNVVLA